ncbi:hypothetical protein EC988_005305, partial [Linderina pennispora]
MSDYEQQRLEQIRKNQEMLAALGLDKPILGISATDKPRTARAKSQPGFTRTYEIRARSTVKYTDDATYEDDGYMTRPRKKINHRLPRLRRNDAGRRMVGNRVYDSALGSTCHQCRQKTMDPKIKCSSDCNVMFDTRCLLIRYGEDADQIDHSTWQCPKCRGCCNCSFCLRKRGKRPTGQLSVYVKQHGVQAVEELKVPGVLQPEVLGSARRSARRRVWDDEVSDDDGEVKTWSLRERKSI